MIFFHTKKNYRYLISLTLTLIFFILLIFFPSSFLFNKKSQNSFNQNTSSIAINLDTRKTISSPTTPVQNATPQPTTPQNAAPQTTAVQTTTPQTTTPQTTAPQTTAPQTTMPQTTVPQTTVPQTTAPQTTTPQNTKPKISAINIIFERINKNLVYPVNAKRRNIQGSVEIKIIVNKLGFLENYQLTKSSGKDILDNAAIKLLEKIFPLPENISGLPLEKTITINYKLTKVL